jgi:hypothetical protein
MIFSSSKKFVFFAVPKTGTHAVREALRPALEENDWEQQILTGRMLSPLPSIASIGHGHISYRQLCQAVGPDVLASYFTFAIVRHPLERFMSVCAFLARTDPSYDQDPLSWCRTAFERDRFRQRVLVRPQTELLVNAAGELAIDFIGRYENLQADLNAVLNRLDLPAVTLQSRNVTQNEKPILEKDPSFVEELEQFYAVDFKLLNFDQD